MIGETKTTIRPDPVVTSCSYYHSLIQDAEAIRLASRMGVFSDNLIITSARMNHPGIMQPWARN